MYSTIEIKLTYLLTYKYIGKLIQGIDYINNMENLLQVEQNSRTRGHSYKLVKPRCQTNRRKQSFFYRVI